MAVVFLSHCTKDKAFALQVEQALSSAYHTVFVDSDHEDGIAPGTDWRVELFAAVTSCDAVVFLNSPNSQASQWCHTELALAALHHKWVYAVNLTGDVAPHPLLADKQSIRLETSFSDSLERLGATLSKDFAGRNANAHWDPSRSPFPGLRSFEAADAGVFFGRDDAVGDVIKRLEYLEMTPDGNLLALIGPSGSGKSSLVKAGVLPRLGDRGDVLIIGPFEPGNFPMDRLVAALKTAAPGVNVSLDAASLEADGLSRLVGRMLDESPANRRALVVIDQVEYLGSVEAKERDTFVAVLDDAVSTGSKLTLLLVARQDRLEEVQRFVPLGRHITSPLAVLPMDLDGLRLAVEEPAAAARMVVDPNLTRKVIEDATDRGGSDAGRALPLVAETLRAVYELAIANNRREMTVDDYDTVGGVKGSIQRYAEQAEAQLVGDLDALDVLLTRFVSLEDDEHPAIGRPVALSLLDDEERRLVGRLQDVRLLTADGESVRIVHDRLIQAWPRLAIAVQARRKDLLFRTQLERQATQWAKNNRAEFLLGTESTEQAEQLLAADTDNAAPTVAKLVVASRHQLTRRRRTRTTVIGALTALAFVASGLAVAATNASSSARRATRVAQARDLITRSLSVADPYQAVLLAIEAESWTPEPLLEARVAWLSAVTELGQQPALRSGTPIPVDDLQQLRSIGWNPEGTVIAIGGSKHLWFFDVATRNLEQPIDLGDTSATSVAWNPAGTVVAIGDSDGSLRFFDVATRNLGDPIDVDDGLTMSLAWSPTGEVVAFGGFKRLSLFDVETRKLGDPIDVDGGVSSLAWDPAGTAIAIGGFDGLLRFFDVATRNLGAPVSTASSMFDLTTDGPSDPLDIGGSFGRSSAWNSAGTTIALGGSDGVLRFFDVATRTKGEPIKVGGSSVKSLAWNPSGTVIATGDDDGTLRLFDFVTPRPIFAGGSDTQSVAWNAAGTAIAIGDDGGVFRFFDADTGLVSEPIHVSDSVTAWAWNPPGTAIAIGDDDGFFRFLEPDTGNVSEPIHVSDSVTSVAWNPPGTAIAFGDDDGFFRFFDAETGFVGDPIAVGGRLSSWAWNPAGTLIAIGDDDGFFRFLEPDAGNVSEPIHVSESLRSWSWSPAGTAIAIGGLDGSLRLFDVASRSVGDPTRVGAAFLTSVAWNPAGTVIAIGDDDGLLHLFDAATLQSLGDPIVTGYGFTTSVAWNPAGTIVATVNSDGTSQLFDSWMETDACTYLQTVMSAQELAALVEIEGAQSKCLRRVARDFPPLPVLDHPLPRSTSRSS